MASNCADSRILNRRSQELHDTVYFQKFIPIKNEHKPHWEKVVPLFLLPYRSSQNEVTGYKAVIFGSRPPMKRIGYSRVCIRKVKNMIERVHNLTRIASRVRILDQIKKLQLITSRKVMQCGTSDTLEINGLINLRYQKRKLIS